MKFGLGLDLMKQINNKSVVLESAKTIQKVSFKDKKKSYCK